MTLLDRLLRADPGVLVKDVIDRSIARTIPATVWANFGCRPIDWRDDREVWGLSFDLLRSESVQLGHVRGHHIASRPEYVGLTPKQAEWIVRREVEGTLLHELGHAVWEFALRQLPPGEVQGVRGELRGALDEEGVPSTYAGDDEEAAAEMFRWYLASPKRFRRDAPRQAAVVEWALKATDAAVRSGSPPRR